ncbi:hypothetical protein VTL71DRAFT_14903 [Oculimacula yallundae]|uniref:Uncharacterized protein n=1 Tax=Oculimacula yallundae TaxID=86028 RepID=A0ABR4CH48_9HELO
MSRSHAGVTEWKTIEETIESDKDMTDKPSVEVIEPSAEKNPNGAPVFFPSQDGELKMNPHMVRKEIHAVTKKEKRKKKIKHLGIIEKSSKAHGVVEQKQIDGASDEDEIM